jgi:hypothetical protein
LTTIPLATKPDSEAAAKGDDVADVVAVVAVVVVVSAGARQFCGRIRFESCLACCAFEKNRSVAVADGVVSGADGPGARFANV